MGRFQTTNWSLVLAARDEPSTVGREALEALCERYWYPLYACVRAWGHDPDASRDLTQGFFALLLEKDYLEEVRPEAGRFRSFLLSSLRHFLSHEREKERALKRGGGTTPISLDSDTAENRFANELADDLTPEEVFERRWALTVLDRALDRLRLELEARGEPERFDRLKQFLTGERPHPSYRDVAAELAMTEAAVKAAVHRLRRRLGRLLREEIGETVAKADEVDDEVRFLLRVVGRAAPAPP
jgi:RNA polymerase sigma-70 factor (ECF subfamily)